MEKRSYPPIITPPAALFGWYPCLNCWHPSPKRYGFATIACWGPNDPNFFEFLHPLPSFFSKIPTDGIIPQALNHHLFMLRGSFKICVFWGTPGGTFLGFSVTEFSFFPPKPSVFCEVAAPSTPASARQVGQETLGLEKNLRGWAWVSQSPWFSS